MLIEIVIVVAVVLVALTGYGQPDDKAQARDGVGYHRCPG